MSELDENLLLHHSIEKRLGFWIPKKSVCKDHQAPLDFIADMYFERITSAVVLGSRTSGKTLDTAILNFLDADGKDGCKIMTVAGSLSQAKRGYEYWKEFWFDREELLAKEPLLSITRLKNGSSLEIAAASTKAVRAPHLPKLRLDEIDEMKKEIYKSALSIPKSSDSIMAQTCKTSTRHKIYGLMHDVWEKALKNDTPRYFWCVWEVVEKCTKKCTGCILVEDCQGKAKKAEGFYSVDDLIARRKELDDDTWRTEWLCEEPSREGLVYKEFDHNKHVVDFVPKGDEYGAIDWGYTNPFVYLKVIVTPSDDVFIEDELYITETAVSSIAPRLKERFDAKVIYADPSGATEIAECKKVGLPVRSEASKVLEGVPIVRKWIKPAEGKPKLFIHKRCKNLIDEMNSYHWKEGKDEVEKEFDHGPDALRYFMVNRYLKYWKPGVGGVG